MNNTQKTTTNLNSKERYCFFCAHNMDHVDYKNANLIRRFTSSYGKIAPRKRSGVCSQHQRKLAEAIKRARIMALLPFVNK